jgi:hypothetical protein
MKTERGVTVVRAGCSSVAGMRFHHPEGTSAAQAERAQDQHVL